MSLLDVRNLSVTVQQRTTQYHAVRDVSLSLERNSCFALVGESGSGKTMTAAAVAGLLPNFMTVTGSARLEETELLALTKEQRRRLAGKDIGFVFQEPMTALHPIFNVERQFDEVFRAHGVGDRSTRRKRMGELLAEVGLAEQSRVAAQRVDQLSGGMRQRVMIALALALGPRLLIADEATTALDVSTQQQVLDLFRRLRRERDLGVLLITHDFAVVAHNADTVGVMYAGQIVETGPVQQVLTSPQHPYTQALLECIPRLGDRRNRLPTVASIAPGLTDDRAGASSSEPCADAPMKEVASGHYVRAS